MLKVIQNYNLQDIKDGVVLLLDRASKCPDVRQHAIQLTQSAQDRIAAVHDWVKQNVMYLSDPIGPCGDEIELFISPVRMVDNYSKGLVLAGDCDDHAILSTALFRSLSMASNVVLANTSGFGIDHAYCRVWSDVFQRWISCDTTTDYPLGWYFPGFQEVIV